MRQKNAITFDKNVALLVKKDNKFDQSISGLQLRTIAIRKEDGLCHFWTGSVAPMRLSAGGPSTGRIGQTKMNN
jgi:hypothetical protein